MNIFDELKARGLVFQTTDEAALSKALTEDMVSYYVGYDPTADSLHLGNLVLILTMKRLQMAGHKKILSIMIEQQISVWLDINLMRLLVVQLV